ncbi:MAG: hypothetical protein ABR591_07780 [Candidatus Velthaea sp.]
MMLRVIGRIIVVGIVSAFVGVVGFQFARIIEKNVALAHELHAVDAEIRMLQAKRIAQQRDVRRLSDPRGAIPEIHDKLHLVSDREAIIYLKKHDGRP